MALHKWYVVVHKGDDELIAPNHRPLHFDVFGTDVHFRSSRIFPRGRQPTRVMGEWAPGIGFAPLAQQLWLG